jgi:hypothetical protein
MNKESKKGKSMIIMKKNYLDYAKKKKRRTKKDVSRKILIFQRRFLE